jgi:rhamnulokinase
MKNELTISSTSQLLSAGSSSWDNKILEYLGIDPEKFGVPDLPGTPIGPLTHPALRPNSMQAVQVCCHDTASAILALPVEHANYAYISSGTWCIVGVESDTPLLSKEALEAGFTNERGYENSYRILKNIVGLWLIQGLKKEYPDHVSHADLEKIASAAEHTEQVIDPDDPMFYNPENMKAAFVEFFQKSGQETPDDTGMFLKCAYDSLCFSFRHHIEKLEKLTGRSIEVLHLIGGGSKSDYLNQKIANVCSRKVISGPVEGATIGNILVQAVSEGVIGSRGEARQIVKKSFPIKYYDPEPKLPDTDQRYEKFKQILQIKTTE